MEKQQNRLIRCVRQLVATAEPRTETDQELLQRFVSQHDEAAFGAVVRRHGPMVLRVALRTLQNEHNSEDVFQATFLVLSQKARTLRRPESLGSWLYGIAYRLALKTKATACQQRNRARSVATTPVATPLARLTLEEAQSILDEELSRLPERFRQPVVLCCLEGLARDEAAQQIGCPTSVLKSRLEQARERLRQRLIARGLTLPCGLGALLLLEGAVSAKLPRALTESTTKAAIAFAGGNVASTVVTTKVAALTEGVLKAMMMSKLKAAVAVLVILGLLVTGSTVLSYRSAAAQGGQPPAAEAPMKMPQKQEKEKEGSAQSATPVPHFPAAQDTKSILEGSKAGDRKELAPGIAFRWCPAGKFKMGEGDGTIDVELSEGFWLGETEVTQGQWKKVMGTSPWSGRTGVGARASTDTTPPKDGSEYAASYISHDDAVSFCKKLTTQEQRAGRLPKSWKYSLPTEAQWEYAGRAGTNTRFSFGDDESKLSQYAWFMDNVDNVKEPYAHQVSLKKPNAWGLCDMHGNVWEWCNDWYASTRSGGKDPVGPTTPPPPGGPPDPVGPITPPPPNGSSGRNRVIRGGSWVDVALGCSSANRFYYNPRLGNGVQGFRLAAVPAGQDDKKPMAEKAVDLGRIQPPGGVPLNFGRPGDEIRVDALNQATKRLESAPAEAVDKWVLELELVMDKKLDGDLAKQACRTYLVAHMSMAFDDLTWNAKAADKLIQRAQTMSPPEAKAWKEAFEALMKKKIGQTATENLDGGPAYAVPLVLIPVDALHEAQKYSTERGKKYLARLKQLAAEDISLWKDKVDQFGGTELDAAVNITLLDDYFDKEKFQRDKFKAAVEARKK